MAITFIYNVQLTHESEANSFVIIEGERISAIGHGMIEAPADWIIIDGQGALLMPGVIDCHVHFREPGLTHKADIASESKAAIAGGVTSYLDMPNTVPQTVTIKDWKDKCEIAKKKSLANHAFFIGATNDNQKELLEADYTKIPGVKLFMGSSTGNMLVDKTNAIETLFEKLPPEIPIAIHAEDQDIIKANTEEIRRKYPKGEIPLKEHTRIRSSIACEKATRRALALAKKHPRHIHICHVSTANEIELINGHNECCEIMATYEVSPHHLLWSKNDYDKKGARIKMNPSVKTEEDRERLIEEAEFGNLTMIATDHAPHLLSEKEGDALTAVSGAPVLQFSLPLMLTLFKNPALVETLMCENPAAVYDIVDRGSIEVGYYADLVLVRKVKPYEIKDSDCISKCGWSPASGVTVEYKIEKTWVNGELVFDKGKFTNTIASKPLEFMHCLPHEEMWIDDNEEDFDLSSDN